MFCVDACHSMAWCGASLTPTKETKYVTQIAMGGPERWAGCLYFPAEGYSPAKTGIRSNDRQPDTPTVKATGVLNSAQLAISRKMTKKYGLLVYGLWSVCL